MYQIKITFQNVQCFLVIIFTFIWIERNPRWLCKGLINWKPVRIILNENYPVGKSEFGNKAYPPLMLMKALLLQKWFGIKSDLDLENQINDRLSFKAFIGLPFSDPSPDHSIICRFRERIGKMAWKRF